MRKLVRSTGFALNLRPTKLQIEFSVKEADELFCLIEEQQLRLQFCKRLFWVAFLI